MKSDLGFESQLHVGNVIAPYNVRPKIVLLIKCAKQIWFLKMFIFPQKKKQKCM